MSGGRTLLSATQVSGFQHVRLQLPKRRKEITQEPARVFGGPRSEPPLPEDTRGDYSMRLSGSPPFACRQLRRSVLLHFVHHKGSIQELFRSSSRSRRRSKARLALRSRMASRERAQAVRSSLSEIGRA